MAVQDCTYINTDPFLGSFVDVFGNDMRLVSVEPFRPGAARAAVTGWWKAELLHCPTGYRIRIENDRGWNHFTVEISDTEGARTFLARLEKYDNRLNAGNLAKAARILKRHLAVNDIPLYIYKCEEGGATQKYVKLPDGAIRRVR